MNSRKLAIIIMLATLSIGTNYAMISLYNVKLMDFIVFISGFCFGPIVGTLTGIISWGVYGTLNPLGFSLPVWLSTMFSESIYGITGAIMKKDLNSNGLNEFKNRRINTYFFFGILGMLLTIAYDIITNVVFGYISGWNILFAVIVGFVPFGLVHMISNAFFFGLGCVPTINAVLNLVGGEKLDASKE